MKLILIFATILALCMAGSVHREGIDAEGKQLYNNYSVYKLIIPDIRIFENTNFFNTLHDEFDIWKRYDEISREVHIMVNNKNAHILKQLTKRYSLTTKIMISDVQNLIDEEKAENDAVFRTDNTFGWSRYHTLDEIEAWIDEILVSYPTITESFIIGKSYEGRDIHGIKISYKDNNPGVFVESTIHAREWIAAASATYLINELLTSDNEMIRQIAENYDWYIIPVLNVDGYVYSHEKDRMWRKTRQPLATSPCIGVDGNRNFDSYWMENGGASTNPCSNTFAGLEPFSEPEMKALSEYLTKIQDKLNVYLSFHSYGQYLLSPYGHNKTEFPPNYDDMQTIASGFSEAIEGLQYNSKYTYGSTASVLYVATGTSVDWVFNELGVKLGYTIEYRDKGRFGFVLPPIQIIPTCEELMAGLVPLLLKTQELGYA